MALPVLDGNQTATTLSSVVTGGEHIVAHSVVSLGANAIANITSAVSGSVVSISNFPPTQTIAGTVTANAGGDFANSIESVFDVGNVSKKIAVQLYDDNGGAVGVPNNPLPISGTVTVGGFSSVSVGSGAILIAGDRGGTITPIPIDSGSGQVGVQLKQSSGPSIDPISQTNGLWVRQANGSSITVGNSVTIGYLPNSLSIVNSSSVTKANVQYTAIAGSVNASDGAPTYTMRPIGVNSSGQIYIDANPAGQSVFSNDGTSHIFVKPTPNTSVTIGSLPAISGTVTANLFGEAVGGGPNEPTKLQCDSNGFLITSLYRSGSDAVNYDPVAGNVSVNVKNVSSVTISSLPAISGTVTANLLAQKQIATAAPTSAVLAGIKFDDDGTIQPISSAYPVPAYLPLESSGIGASQPNNAIQVGFETGGNYVAAGSSFPFPVTGTVTIGSLPAISGTVTVGNNNFNIKTVIAQDGSANFTVFNGTQFRLYTPTGASKTLNNIFGATPSWVVAFSDSVTWFSDSGTQVAYFHDGTQWTLDDFTTPAGTLALDGSVFVTNLSYESNINILNGFTAAQLGTAYINGSGALRVSVYSGTVTAAAPNGSLTTRFGTPTTANTAFATSAVTNANRKYLLIQNVTTGSNVITVGIGFTPTTTQGIQLTAGAGITFESSYIPTGAVQILSSVTASNFTILEA
jgi:hypothetical protein